MRRNLGVGDDARFHANRGKEFFIEPQDDGTLKIGSVFTFSRVFVDRVDDLGCIYLAVMKENEEAEQEVEKTDAP